MILTHRAALFARLYYSEALYAKYITGPEFVTLWLGAIITFQALLWLATFWSTSVLTLFTTTQASSVDEADLIKVQPIENSGSAEICRIEREIVRYWSTKYIAQLTRLDRWYPWKAECVLPISKETLPLQLRIPILQDKNICD